MAMWLNDSENEAKPLARIDLTPMIGVLAALLVMFSLSVPTLSRLPVQLPLIGGDWFAPPPQYHHVVLSADGSILFDGLPTRVGDLDRFVAAFDHSSREHYFRVHVAAQTRYADVAALLETFSRNRVRYFGLEN
jgi:biopolymer transport protein ExbD